MVMLIQQFINIYLINIALNVNIRKPLQSSKRGETKLYSSVSSAKINMEAI